MKTIEDNQTIKNNVLIGNFMGWDEFNTGSYHTPYDNATYCNGEESSICDKYALKFNSSWDWLMPVVEKIANLHLKENVTTLPISSNIKTVWDACLEFIKWYNEQNK